MKGFAMAEFLGCLVLSQLAKMKHEKGWRLFWACAAMFYGIPEAIKSVKFITERIFLQ